MNTNLPPDPNISVLPFELYVCIVLVGVALVFLPCSCKGFDTTASIGYKDLNAKVTIKPVKNDK